jgi:hypothetical protein
VLRFRAKEDVMAEGSSSSSVAIVVIFVLAIAVGIFFFINSGGRVGPADKDVNVELNVPKPDLPNPAKEG